MNAILAFTDPLTEGQGWTLIGVLALLVGGLIHLLRELIKVQGLFARNIASQGVRQEAVRRDVASAREDLKDAHKDLGDRIDAVPERSAEKTVTALRRHDDKKETA